MPCKINQYCSCTNFHRKKMRYSDFSIYRKIKGEDDNYSLNIPILGKPRVLSQSARWIYMLDSLTEYLQVFHWCANTRAK